jgi:hypothetical protein
LWHAIKLNNIHPNKYAYFHGYVNPDKYAYFYGYVNSI